MSTKATVFDDGYINFYEETSESQHSFGKFRGYNLHLVIESDLIKTINFSDDYVTITIDQFTIHQSSYEVFKEIKLWLHPILEMDVDYPGGYVSIVLKGGEYYVNELIKELRIKETKLR